MNKNYFNIKIRYIIYIFLLLIFFIILIKNLYKLDYNYRIITKNFSNKYIYVNKPLFYLMSPYKYNTNLKLILLTKNNTYTAYKELKEKKAVVLYYFPIFRDFDKNFLEYKLKTNLMYFNISISKYSILFFNKDTLINSKKIFVSKFLFDSLRLKYLNYKVYTNYFYPIRKLYSIDTILLTQKGIYQLFNKVRKEKHIIAYFYNIPEKQISCYSLIGKKIKKLYKTNFSKFNDIVLLNVEDGFIIYNPNLIKDINTLYKKLDSFKIIYTSNYYLIKGRIKSKSKWFEEKDFNRFEKHKNQAILYSDKFNLSKTKINLDTLKNYYIIDTILNDYFIIKKRNNEN